MPLEDAFFYLGFVVTAIGVGALFVRFGLGLRAEARAELDAIAARQKAKPVVATAGAS